jgi:hypothetical protein
MSRLDEALVRLERAVARLEAAWASIAGDSGAAPDHNLAEAEGRPPRAATQEIGAEADRVLARAGRVPAEKGEQ